MDDNIMIRRFTYFCIVVLMASCSPEAQTITTPQPPTTQPATEIDLWFHSSAGQQRDAIVEILNSFNRSQDQIHIRIVELPEVDYHSHIEAAEYGAAIGGTLPCVLDFDGPYLHNYVWEGRLIPLDDYLTDAMRRDFLPTIIEQGTYLDNSIYALGSFDSGLAVWANQRYLDQIDMRMPTVEHPWTLEEFEAVLAQLQALPGVEHAMDMKMNYEIGEWYTHGFSPLVQSFGGDLINRQTGYAEGALNSEQSVAALTTLQSWFDTGYVDAGATSDTDFVEGRAALSWVGHWVYGPYHEALGDDLLLLPMPDFGTGPKTGVGSWAWGITTNCQHPDAAWEVLEYILQPANIDIATRINHAIPARRTVLEQSDLYSEHGPLRLYIDQFEAGYHVFRPQTAAYPHISEVFQQVIRRVADGDDVRTVLEEATRAIDAYIETNIGYQ